MLPPSRQFLCSVYHVLLPLHTPVSRDSSLPLTIPSFVLPVDAYSHPRTPRKTSFSGDLTLESQPFLLPAHPGPSFSSVEPRHALPHRARLGAGPLLRPEVDHPLRPGTLTPPTSYRGLCGPGAGPRTLLMEYTIVPETSTLIYFLELCFSDRT